MPVSNKLKVEEGVYGITESPNIERIRFGEYELNTWYGSTVYFAQDKTTLGYKYANLDKELQSRRKVPKVEKEIWLEKLFVCDNCFKYTDIKETFQDHVLKCELNSKQLGKIVYRENNLTIRKVCGAKHKLFTQNLCLFTKLYLDNKSVFFGVENFDFYIVYDNVIQKPMGFFSKEKLSLDRNNLACILIFPPYQRKHLGTLLISFSYELSKVEHLISGPEKPLSPFGLIGYLRYWTTVIVRVFIYGQLREFTTVSMSTLSTEVGMRQDDIETTLKYMNVLVKKEDGDDKIYIKKDLLRQWAKDNNITEIPILERKYLLI
ncbi:hypothetical protein WICMUC_002715 [Wickerhamomyces mucosus]|uniref:histone acetyltransferase n=1 Tax=Wickerhamomyces mucosus TaxID=1378264 RepID=A0A9P8TEI3_9ASCO|nr:hypothetical protein WICMUC_002715 [Wickerhamomyces mucosus]